MHIEMGKHDFPGLLLAFCGTDGVGKTTQIELVADHIQKAGRKILLTKQPTQESRDLPLFKRYLFHPEERKNIDYRALLCLMASDRLQHIHEVILPALADNQVVITDRYVFTMLATMWARGYENEQWVYDLCRYIPRPDATFLLDVPLELAIERIRARKHWEDSYVERQHLVKTKAAFLQLAHDCDLHIIDTSNSDVMIAFESVKSIVDTLRC